MTTWSVCTVCTEKQIFMYSKWIRRVTCLFVYGSAVNPFFLIQECEVWNVSTVILREDDLNGFISFVQKSSETRHIFEIGLNPGSNRKVIHSERFIVYSPGRKLKPKGFVICSEAINSWECFPPVLGSMSVPWLHPSLSRMWRKMKNGLWLRIPKPLYLEMLSFQFYTVSFLSWTHHQDIPKPFLQASHSIDCYKLFHL